MAWTSQPPELIVPYDPEQRALYEKDDPNSIFFSERWPSELRSGRQRDGRFPEIAVRSSLRALGFSVLISEPRLPHGQGFVLAHYARMRERNHDAYKLMCTHFAPEQIEEFNQQADEAKIRATGNRGGGDPDLFVFRDSGERFFVEVKEKDGLHRNQLVTFPLIESILGCVVRVARLEPRAGARPSDMALT